MTHGLSFQLNLMRLTAIVMNCTNYCRWCGSRFPFTIAVVLLKTIAVVQVVSAGTSHYTVVLEAKNCLGNCNETESSPQIMLNCKVK